MLEDLISKSERDKIGLAPLIGIGCPGIIREDGSIETGAQNLPGNWQASTFNLSKALCKAIPRIGKHETVVVIHNDAVVQGLSELPAMQVYDKWGVLTIGTGLGNARFTNRHNGESD
jgi:predicted NBD/HSP70 family sugar kinase